MKPMCKMIVKEINCKKICLVYKGESSSLKSLLMKTADKIDQDYWLNSGV